MIKLVILDIDGVITDGKVYFDAEGREIKTINYKDIDTIFQIKKNYKLAFITGENSDMSNYFQKRFNPDFFYKGIKDKINIIREIEKKLNIDKSEICFVGDSKHDLEAIKYVGLGVCPKDAVDEVKEITDVILEKKCGDSCLAELINILDKVNKDCFMKNEYLNHISLLNDLFFNKRLVENIKIASDIILKAFNNNNKILLCGNGGSAADCQHIATEFVSKFYIERKGLNAEAITVNTSSLTAIGNDYSFHKIFSRQIEAKGKKSDILIAITTSGESKNIIEAVKKAKEIGMITILLTGRTYNKALEEYSDIIVDVNSKDTPRIQEAHIFIGHCICKYVEERIK